MPGKKKLTKNKGTKTNCGRSVNYLYCSVHRNMKKRRTRFSPTVIDIAPGCKALPQDQALALSFYGVH